MGNNKKSFILYSDLLHKIEMLTIEERGILFTHLLEYVNDLNPVLTDRLLLTAWKPIELELKRNLKKYEEAKEKKSNGGRLGNLKRWNTDLYNDVVDEKITLEEAEKIAISRKASHTDTNLSHTIAPVADNVNDNDNDDDNVNDNDNNNNKKEEFFDFRGLKFPLPHQEHIKKFKENSISLETFMIQNGIKNESELNEMFFEFLKHLNIGDETYPKNNFKEFRRHFVNWSRISIKNREKSVKINKNLYI